MIAQTVIVTLPQTEGIESHVNIKLPDHIRMMSTSAYQNEEGKPLLAITLLVESKGQGQESYRFLPIGSI